MRAAPTTADVLLAPAGSPQLIASLRSMFPKARVVITEIEDEELGVNYQGPVQRLLNAGADAYLPAMSVPRLARQLDYTLTHGLQLTGGIAVPLAIEATTEPPDPERRLIPPLLLPVNQAINSLVEQHRREEDKKEQGEEERIRHDDRNDIDPVFLAASKPQFGRLRLSCSVIGRSRRR